MKKAQISSAILIALFVLASNITIIPKVTAPLPSPRPNRFIADIFPNNNNTIIHLLNVSANITLNALDRYNEIGISFIGKYSLFNPDKLTNITIILPLSLCLDIEHATFGVSVNDTQVPFEVVSTTKENLTSLGVNLESMFRSYLFNFFYNPITLIASNLTLMENTTYVVKYQFEGSIPEPLKEKIFYMIYSSEPAKFWKGNATERVEYNIFGGNPQFSIFGQGGPWNGSSQLLDIVGGKKFIYEWINAQEGWIGIGISFDERGFLTPIDLIVLNASVCVAIIIVIVLYIRRGKKKQFRFGVKPPEHPPTTIVLTTQSRIAILTAFHTSFFRRGHHGGGRKKLNLGNLIRLI
jgi:hypothetical protein